MPASYLVISLFTWDCRCRNNCIYLGITTKNIVVQTTVFIWDYMTINNCIYLRI